MDGQIMGNEQNNNRNLYSHYQDNTANIPSGASEEIAESNKANTLQIVGLICGIAGIVLGCCFGVVGLIIGVVGLICAITGNKQGATGVGTGAIICSIIAIAFSLISMIISLIFGAAVLSQLSGYYY